MNEIIQTIAVYALPVLFAITLHEAAHAYAAKYFGDLTAYSQGRMSLNPAKHIDPFGTILIPLLLALVSSPFLFGYARPVPVDFARLRNPKKDMAWVALAGPAANLMMGLLWMALFFVMDAANIEETYFYEVARAGVKIKGDLEGRALGQQQIGLHRGDRADIGQHRAGAKAFARLGQGRRCDQDGGGKQDALHGTAFQNGLSV